MSDVVIETDGLSERYRLGVGSPGGMLREAVYEAAARTWARLRGRPPESAATPVRDIWALKDVSLSIGRGEVVGFVGRNGAGKSTLLKILSRITAPTAGQAAIRGRVGSLLEVGTGFHPELTGRENIYLNGTLLGMSRRHIASRFEAIVDFAGIGPFLDTPVKRYSSGMYVRLAFAVAAHLEPEILIVDEVLAVGDAAFQEKCLGKMSDVAKAGRTVLFVSHNMAALRTLCSRCVLLESGQVVEDGAPAEVVEHHIRRCGTGSGNLMTQMERTGTGRAQVEQIELLDRHRRPATDFFMGEPLHLHLRGKATEPDTTFSIGIQLVTETGIPAVYLYDQYRTFTPTPTPAPGMAPAPGNSPGSGPGKEEALVDKPPVAPVPASGYRFDVLITVPKLPLMPGRYFVNVWLGRSGMEAFDKLTYAAAFRVCQSEHIRTTFAVGQREGLTVSDYEAVVWREAA